MSKYMEIMFLVDNANVLAKLEEMMNRDQTMKQLCGKGNDGDDK